MLLQAKAAGCPRDQIERFLAAGYVPLPKQLLFHAAARQADKPGMPDKIALGGARGPGKSHAIFAQIALDDCQRLKSSRWLYLRKVGKAARESADALRTKILGHVPHTFNRQEGMIKFPNGSTIITGHFQNEKDIDLYTGLEYDGLAIEEYTQLSKVKIEMIRGSRRSSKPGWRPRDYISTNPGGVGHTHFKADFVYPQRANREIDTRFFDATYKDNPWLDEGYIAYLKGLTGVLGRMWRDGDWDVGAGQYFVHWDYAQHVISKWQYWPIPAHWPVWAGFDYGFGHPTSVHFYTEVNGILYTIAEHIKPYWLPKQHAAALKDIARTIGRDLRHITFHAGHDCFSRESTGRTIAEQYAEEGVNMVPATINREQGAAAMLERLGDPRGGITPTWYILDTCPVLAETIPAMQTSPSNAKDVIKVDADEAGEGGDDCLVAGTPVFTRWGQIPIQLIRPGDEVLTRAGWRPVRDVWQAHRNSGVLTAHLSDGRKLTGTPNHPVWIQGKGFTYLDAVRYGDIIETIALNQFYRSGACLNQKPLSLMESSFEGIQSHRNALIACITGLAETIASEVSGPCMSKSGSTITEQFQRVGTSTIETAILSTMLLRIWSAYLLRNTRPGTSPNGTPIHAAAKEFLSTWTRFDRLLPLGTAPLRDWSGIRNMAKTFLETGRSLKAPANSAEKRIRCETLTPSSRDFALTNANPHGEGQWEQTILSGLARLAAASSQQANLSRQHTVAESAPGPHVAVLEITSAGKSNSYALHVADQHEYYANGILVRNCYDSARYGLMANAAASGGGFETRSRS